MRGGADPSRGSGVTVFVTKPSSPRATSGAASASRQPDALSSRKDRPFQAEALERSVDLDDAAVAGAVAAGHPSLPRELGGRRELAHRVQHRLRPARENVKTFQVTICHKRWFDYDFRLWRENRRGFGIGGRAEARDDARRAAELVREIRQRRDADPAADEQRPLDVEPVPVAERPEDRDLVAGRQRRDRLRPRPDRIDEESELAGRRDAERERTREEPPGCLEHEELPRHAGLEHAALD